MQTPELVSLARSIDRYLPIDPTSQTQLVEFEGVVDASGLSAKLDSLSDSVSADLAPSTKFAANVLHRDPRAVAEAQAAIQSLKAAVEPFSTSSASLDEAQQAQVKDSLDLIAYLTDLLNIAGQPS